LACVSAHAPAAALLAWGRNDAFFPEAGAHAYLQDLPEAELHLLDTGHFATATHSDEIAELVGAFLARHVAPGKTTGGRATKA